MTTRPKKAGVIGWPIGHTLSPLIHRYWAEKEGADAVYLPLSVEPGRQSLARAIASVRAMGFAGVNVTLPHKEDALRAADAASDSARAVGAANMLTFVSGQMRADNSDATGFAAAIAPMLANRPEVRAFVLGGGGAARAVAFALRELLSSASRRIRLAVANRTAERAAAIASAFGGEAIAWADRAKVLGGADLLVNATSLGMRGMPALEIDIDSLPQTALVADIVYAPLATPLLRAARDRGLRTLDGLGMLMHQAAPAYQSWLGARAPVDALLRSRLEAALAERAQ
jgi:shikimate dehydrogenase